MTRPGLVFIDVGGGGTGLEVRRGEMRWCERGETGTKFSEFWKPCTKFHDRKIVLGSIHSATAEGWTVCSKETPALHSRTQ